MKVKQSAEIRVEQLVTGDVIEIPGKPYPVSVWAQGVTTDSTHTSFEVKVYGGYGESLERCHLPNDTTITRVAYPDISELL
jgi:hypothetical protein